jgi:hypothetical protein
VRQFPSENRPPLGERDNSLVDVNGDGKADVVAQNHMNLVAYLSTGFDFEQGQIWYDRPFYSGVYSNE